MSRKIICESCETIFKEELVKDMANCPVCGASFDEEDSESMNTELQEDEDSSGESILFVYDISFYDGKPEYNSVDTYCKECGKTNFLNFDLFDKLVDNYFTILPGVAKGAVLKDGDYILLKKGTTVTCEGCGKKHTARKIFYQKRIQYTPPVPHCPACNSTMLKKISKGSKIMAAAALGPLALSHNTKTFQCKNCGYKF